MNKQCLKCNLDLDYSMFSKNKRRKDGYSCYYKLCNSISQKVRYIVKLDEYKAVNKRNYHNNREKHIELAKKWAKDNPDRYKSRQRKWRKENKEYNRAYHKEYQRVRKQNDPNFKILNLLRRRLLHALVHQRVHKDNSVMKLIDCSLEQLKSHLESMFLTGMTWQNHGRNGWHIDHIKPCASFNLADPEQQKLCFHYTNLQPLWQKDNLTKGSKYDGIHHKVI